MTTPVTPEQTARHLQRLAERRALRAAARGERLRASLPEAARLLREAYGADRVVLFGSLATDRVGEESDVDLAVCGLPAEDYFAALADLMGLFEAPVDLVRLEEAPVSLRERVEAEGVSL